MEQFYKDKEFLKRMQNYIAQTSIGASTARGLPKGTVKAAREYLKELKLSEFSNLPKIKFQDLLDKKTNELLSQLPKYDKNKIQIKPWGSTRKFINIFLSRIIYNKYLCTHYKLEKIEPFLEVPLDSYVANHLRYVANHLRKEKLPSWKNLKDLKKIDSDKYQEFAKILAKEKNMHRVHLDLEYWRQPTKTKKI